MFLDRGFELTTVEAVARAIGMTKRTVYAQYADKATLFKAAVQQAIQQWIVPREVFEAMETDDLAATLKQVARQRIDYVMTPQGLKLQRILFSESYRFPEIFTAAFEQGTRPVVQYLADLFSRHHATGAIAVTEPERAALAFFSLVVSGPVHFMVAGMQLEASGIDSRLDYSIALFLKAIEAR